jgi:anti-anti-sigma regulatory factor
MAITAAAWTEYPATSARVLQVRSVFDAVAGERLAQRIVYLAAGGQQAIVVDLSGIEAVGADAIAPLVAAARRLEADGVRISVVVDSSLQTFAMPGIEAFYDVAVTAQDAVARLARRGAAARGAA